MNCSRCSRWFQIGLVVLTSSLTTAVHAATLEDYVDSAGMSSSFTIVDPVVADPVVSEPVEPMENTAAEPMPEVEPVQAEIEPVQPAAVQPSVELEPVDSVDKGVAPLAAGDELSEELLPEAVGGGITVPAEAVPTTQILSADGEDVVVSGEEKQLDETLEPLFETVSLTEEPLSVSGDESVALPAEAVPRTRIFSARIFSGGEELVSEGSDAVELSDGELRDFDAPIAQTEKVSIPEEALPTTITMLPGSIVPSVRSEGVLIAQAMPSGIVPDGTLGVESSVVTPNVEIKDEAADLIEGGATRGSNLFHSFEDFSIGDGQRVYFADPVGIENILSRVTGGDVSEIDGLLGVDGTANLFLLNPNGVLFGPDAELDIRGSFTASTADTYQFEGATAPVNIQGNDFLTMSVPVGVQRGMEPQGDVTNEGDLAVDAGQSLTLFGNTVLSSGDLVAPGGTVQVLGNLVGLVDQLTVDVSGASGGGTVLVGGDYQGQGTVPTAERTTISPEVVIAADALETGDGGRVIVWADEATQFLGDISAQGGPQGGDGGFVEVSGLAFLDFAGEVNTQAVQGEAGLLLLDPANIAIANTAPAGFITIGQSDGVFTDFLYGELENAGQDSHITSNTVETLLSLNDLTLEATDTIVVTDDVNASSENDLTLQAATIEILDARLGQSGGGDIVLETPQVAGSSVLVSGGLVDASVLFGTDLEGGDVIITTHDLMVESGGVVSTTIFGQGESGQVEITATGDVIVDGIDSFIDSQVARGASGNSGGVSITTDNLSVLNDAVVSTTIFGQGESGQVEITATGDVIVDGTDSFIASQVAQGASGNSGSVSIITDNLSVLNDAEISSTIFGEGDSGQLEIVATGDIVVDGANSFIVNEVAQGASGNSGGVSITTDNLSVLNDAEISSTIFGEGDSGQVEVEATGDIRVDGRNSSIASDVGSNGVGNSGGVSITTDNLSVLNAAGISANTSGEGHSGQLEIKATGDIVINDESLSFFNNPVSFIRSQVNSGANGNSGGVSITTDNLSILNDAEISSNTFGEGHSGQVEIEATGNIIVDGENSTIASDVGSSGVGNSGGVSITTDNLSVLNDAEISSTIFGEGDSGQVEIDATGDIRVDGRNSSIASDVGESGIGNSGDVSITADNLSVFNDAEISASTSGKGYSGQVTIEATEEVKVGRVTGNLLSFDNSLIASDVDSGAVGDSGGISISASSLSLVSGADVRASTEGQGDSGQVKIEATENGIMVEGLGSSIASMVRDDAVGDSGGISIFANSLSLVNGASVNASTEGQGDSGWVAIEATEDVMIDSVSLIASNVGSGAAGDSGGVSITANALDILNDSGVRANTSGQGNSGQVKIEVREDVTVKSSDGNDNDGRFSFIESEVKSGAVGDSGGISITADSLNVLNTAFVNAGTNGQGDSGQLQIETTGEVMIDNTSIIGNEVSSGAEGNSGGVSLIANSLNVLNGSGIVASTLGQGNAGQLQIEITGEVNIHAASLIISDVSSGAEGNSGGVSLIADSLNILNSSGVAARIFGQGNAGQVMIKVTGEVNVHDAGSFISSQVLSDAVGNSSGVSITANSLNVLSGAAVSASTFGQGNSGQVLITATGDVTVDGADSGISSTVNKKEDAVGDSRGAVGNSGGISITANSLDVLNGADISANTFAQGDSGQVLITATGDVTVDGKDSFISSQVSSGAVGNSGGISITANSLDVLNGAAISASTFAQGNSGQVLITATGDVTVDGAGSFIDSQVGSGAVGNSGGVSITANSLDVLNGADISASTFAQGNSGQVLITAMGDVEINKDSDITSQVGDDAVGNSGGVSITANSLSVLNDAGVTANTFGQGNSGQVLVIATGNVTVDGAGSFIDSQVWSGAVGNSGGISITANSLSVLNDAGISASTFGQGNSGQVQITAMGDVELNKDSGIVSQVNSGAVGNSDGVLITANSLSVLNDAAISASTFGQGNSGQVQIEVREDVTVEGDGDENDDRFSFIGSEVGSDAVGNSDGVLITANSLNVLNDARVSVSTFGQGDSSSIFITANQLNLLGGLLGAVTSDSIGNGGDIEVKVDSINIKDGGISVETFGPGDGGDIVLQPNNSNRITINTTDGGNNNPDDGLLTISASTSGSGAGGSITIRDADVVILNNTQLLTSSEASNSSEADSPTDNVSLGPAGNIKIEDVGILFMRQGSLIQAGADGDANGGNVDIDAEFVITVPSEDNDILANARRGTGGNITINANRIIGFQEVEEFSNDLRGNGRSDISASADEGIDGQVNLNNFLIDPNQGLNELPETVEDPSDRIARGCHADLSGDSSTGNFAITGRSGQPLNPANIASDTSTLDDLGPIDAQAESSLSSPETTAINTPPPVIEDAQKAIRTDSGEIRLVAQGPWHSSVSCSDLH